MIHPIPFSILSVLTVAGALGVILARHPVYAVLSLVTSMFGLSALFLFLNAPFVAAIQILVYAGAILVLFLFVVMLMDQEKEMGRRIFPWIGIGFGLLFLSQLAVAARGMVLSARDGPGPEGTTAALGKLLFTTYALPFEVASLLLLVGIVGAVVLAQKDRHD